MGVVKEHRGGADNGRPLPELITGRREQRSSDGIGEALARIRVGGVS
jgi:hypothetical protein